MADDLDLAKLARLIASNDDGVLSNDQVRRLAHAILRAGYRGGSLMSQADENHREKAGDEALGYPCVPPQIRRM